MAVSEFAAGSLRELRLKAGWTQLELAKRSGITNAAISNIEKGKAKPRELTWRKLLKALSGIGQDPRPQAQLEEAAAIPDDGRPCSLFSEIFTREQFFDRLKKKLCDELRVFFDESLVRMLVDNAEFFSRQKFYPGDLSTGVAILGELLRAQRRLLVGDGQDEDGSLPRPGRRRRNPGRRGKKKKA